MVLRKLQNDCLDYFFFKNEWRKRDFLTCLRDFLLLMRTLQSWEDKVTQVWIWNSSWWCSLRKKWTRVFLGILRFQLCVTEHSYIRVLSSEQEDTVWRHSTLWDPNYCEHLLHLYFYLVSSRCWALIFFPRTMPGSPLNLGATCVGQICGECSSEGPVPAVTGDKWFLMWREKDVPWVSLLPAVRGWLQAPLSQKTSSPQVLGPSWPKP